MIFGAAEILLCIVPAFLIIFVAGIWLFVNDQKRKKREEENDSSQL